MMHLNQNINVLCSLTFLCEMQVLSLYILKKKRHIPPCLHLIDVQKMEGFTLFSDVLYESAKMRALCMLQIG